ncbi:MAG: hypothetical protein KJ550_04450 [Proteobacteria bacterium]|nr:hypothetical protein [Desulfobacteraceae bacterium]MBU2521444.1 hypothetical protein [Pseudomonadota bacterium]MBU3980630.1 hypothetical protein [Pseudomonadota bacterium]MBU4012697.1 hypothetical protein [Pseudomonadota bacterium]MBU4069127.1 hypothetical protein [Pseudomonadota bacterium]
MSDTFILDNGGRRSDIERRKFSYTNYLPERRSGEDRRFRSDRRKERYAHREGPERRFVF